MALIDVLGFKNIEKRHDPATVAKALESARHAIASLTQWLSTDEFQHFNVLGGGRPDVWSSWFSDTICVVAQLPKPGPLNSAVDENDPMVQAVLVEVVVRCVGTMIRDAADSETPLAFRGVVHVGELIADRGESIYFGPAINEASELYEVADGAFVWLTPAAARLPYNYVANGEGGLVWYEVPTKAGALLTRVVSPFFNVKIDSSLMRLGADTAQNRILEGFKAAMTGDRIDIVVKRQNTERFLRKLVAKDPSLHTESDDALDGLAAALNTIAGSEQPDPE